MHSLTYLVTSDPKSVSQYNVQTLKHIMRDKTTLRQLQFEEEAVKKTIAYFDENFSFLHDTLKDLEKLRGWLAARKYNATDIGTKFPNADGWFWTVSGVKSEIEKAYQVLALSSEEVEFLRFVVFKLALIFAF